MEEQESQYCHFEFMYQKYTARYQYNI